MKFGIILAMDEEFNSLVKKINVLNECSIYDLKFYEAKYKNIDLVLVKSKVGKVNAARTTQILIDNYKISYIFNIGVAGGVSSNLNVLDIVVGEKLCEYDFDISVFDHPKGYIPNTGIYIKSDEYLLSIARKVANNHVKFGVIATGDKFLTSKEDSLNIKKEFNALCVEMEGASIAMTSYLSKIPFLVIRSISDICGEENKLTHEKFLEKSSLAVTSFLLEIFDNLN